MPSEKKMSLADELRSQVGLSPDILTANPYTLDDLLSRAAAALDEKDEALRNALACLDGFGQAAVPMIRAALRAWEVKS